MKDTNVKVNWKSIFAQVIVTLVVTALFARGLYLINLEGLRINISDSTQIGNEYYTTISFINFKKTSIHDVIIYLNDDIDVLSVDGDSNVIKNANTIRLKQINPKGKLSCLVKTTDKIEKNNIIVDNNIKIAISFFSASQDTLLMIILLCIYALFNTVAVYISERISAKFSEKNKKRIQAINNKLDETKEKSDEEVKELKCTLSDQDARIKATNKEIHKLRIYYQIRINDLNKELDFWRNTIRKMLFNSSDKFNSAEVVIEMVTNELKTYTTRERNKDSIDEIFYLANIISEKDNN